MLTKVDDVAKGNAETLLQLMLLTKTSITFRGDSKSKVGQILRSHQASATQRGQECLVDGRQEFLLIAIHVEHFGL